MDKITTTKYGDLMQGGYEIFSIFVLEQDFQVSYYYGWPLEIMAPRDDNASQVFKLPLSWFLT